MKRLSLLALLSLVFPLVVSALDYSPSNTEYEDAPFSRSEAAGISVLTNIGAVSGNPDGTFAPNRTLNRAEFLKIVLIPYIDSHSNAFSGYDWYQNGSVENNRCFPDVSLDDWFGMYVCEAKDLGVVAGYPDGTFKPGNAVNYAEALKILAELYDYELPEPPANERWSWYTQYVKAAEEHETLLPMNLAFDAFLTRGQMARLAAAFVAEEAGELDVYREFERGRTPSVSSGSSSASSESSGSSESSSVSSESSASSASSPSVSAAQSRFLILGETSRPIMDGLFTSNGDNAVIRLVQVELDREVQSIQALELLDGSGEKIAHLRLAISNNTDDTKWEAIGSDISEYVLPANTPKRLSIRAVLKTSGLGGAPNELLEPRYFNIYAQSEVDGATSQLVPTDARMPSHQTAKGTVTDVSNELATSLSVPEGTNRTLGTFSMEGYAGEGGYVELNSLTFELQRTNVSLTNIRIGGSAAIQQEGCSIEHSTVTLLTCSVIPDAFSTISSGPVTLTLYGDIALSGGATTGQVQVRSIGAGKIGQIGTVGWTDGTGTYNWIDADVDIEDGPVVTVTK